MMIVSRLTATLAVALLMLGPRASAQPSATAIAGKTGSRDYDNAALGLREKIVGGMLAKENAYPWQVSLQTSWGDDPSKAHFCGGSLYTLSWVVTAAHCVVGLRPGDLVVMAGTNHLRVGIPRVSVDRITVHRQYVKTINDNDIALIHLREPLTLGQSVQTIGFVPTYIEATFESTRTPLIVTGWGATAEGGNTVDDLREVSIQFLDRAACNAPLSYNNKITENMICAGIPPGGKDSCQGDSGGPLVQFGDDGHAVLVGIVSWGEGCARALKYGVYTRASRYEDWVRQNAK